LFEEITPFQEMGVMRKGEMCGCPKQVIFMELPKLSS
jgi:hypothetical protein